MKLIPATGRRLRGSPTDGRAQPAATRARDQPGAAEDADRLAGYVAAQGRCEVQMPASLARLCQPLADLRRFVCGEVVEHDVDLQLARDAAVDLLEEGEHVDAGVSVTEVADDLAACDVECREQVGGAVGFVVVGQRLRAAAFERQRRLRAVERLHLRLLVEGEDNGTLGRVD